LTWKNILKNQRPDYPDLDGDGDTDEPMVDALATVAQVESVKKESLLKEESEILNALDSKKRKKLKKTLQTAEPTEYFGQDYTKLGELIMLMEGVDLVKDDSKMQKKMKSINEQNVDMVATASKLRKQYEQLYRQVRKIVYPKSAGSLRDEK
tara:strand:+ start:688 stop:1143 length:456 start_codon:yes stop_codon:yes gene_type:complete